MILYDILKTDSIGLSFFIVSIKKILIQRARCVRGFSVGATRPFHVLRENMRKG